MMRRSDSIADMMPEALRQSRYHMKRCFQRYVSQGTRLMKQQHLLEELHGGGGSAAVDNKDSSRLADDHALRLPQAQGNPIRQPLGALDLSTPRLTLPSSIGNGMHLVSRFLPSRLGGGSRPGTGTATEKTSSMKKPLLDYLLVLRYRPGDQQNKLLIIDTVGKLQAALLLAQAFVSEQHPDTPYQQMAHRLQEWGLEKGWGDTPEACGQTLACLSEVLQAPDPASIDRFFSRVPSVFDVVIFSVYGYFGQQQVLGMPDTGDQVVYILDQTHTLWYHSPCPLLQLTRLIPEAKGTRHSSILRVPFKTQDGQDMPHWVSRFDIYPYLERYAQDSCAKILDILGRKPDLVIGNYTDGNLVAYLVSRKLGVSQGTIAHALEKTKYEDSDVKWREMDHKYHFSCQFTADMIAMNTSDFIIASTYQEIAGRGYLENRSKPVIFSMAGLDKVKNITGLVEWYGQDKRLRDLVNLVVVGGLLDPTQSKDREEIEEINKMHSLINKYQLKGQIRWIKAQTDRVRNGELYRCIADTRGAFVQKCNEDPMYWNRMSTTGLQRIYECYTWQIYATKVLNMGSMYGFWRTLDKEEKQAKQQYLQMFYNLHFRKLKDADKDSENCEQLTWTCAASLSSLGCCLK
ncbi:unnamed protein product [Miscanthus lutarioriparius]|uniref:sucrose synthase n=1 Tax=Miscanthus lutarioriparius TaxID=422564 RepID=A0A811PVH8_9POAL|nr:unnamed protein product [Miscanthus lutarioriparius]